MQEFWFQVIAPGRAFHAAAMEPTARPVPRHTHDFREVFVVLEGRGLHQLARGHQPLAAGDQVWVRPHDAHRIRPIPGTGFRFVNLAFPVERWDAFVACLDRPDWAARLDASPEPILEATSGETRARRERAAIQAVHDYADGAGAWALVRALAELASPEPTYRIAWQQGPPWLREALAAFDQEAGLSGGVPALRALAGVSPAHLSRSVREATGLTPSELVRDLRLRRAAQHLAAGASVAEAAFAVGFRNLGYFHRAFARHWGLPPAGYRRRAVARVA